MAAKLECPVCHRVLKEEGDLDKEAQGEYRVYDSLPTLVAEAGQHRAIECIKCGSIVALDKWMDPRFGSGEDD